MLLTDRLNQAGNPNGQHHQLQVPVAQPGDVCVLVEPAASERERVEQLQSTLQSELGGRFHQRVHFTSQRFHLEHAHRMSQLIEGLHQQMSGLRPIPVVASSLMLVEHPFWRCQVLRWELKINEQMRRFARQLDVALVVNGASLHYPQNGDWRPHVTALEAIQNDRLPVPSYMAATDYLFTAHQVVLSQLQEGKRFEILDVIELDGG